MGESLIVRKGGGEEIKGSYVWKKSKITFSMQEGSFTFSDLLFRDIPIDTTFTVYSSDNYTFNEATGVFTLVEPITATNVTTSNTINLYNKYAIVNATSTKEAMFTSTNYAYGRAVHFAASNSDINYALKVFIGPSNKLIQRKYSRMLVLNKEFKTYVIADNEDKYPLGDIYTDGYFYERLTHWYELSADKAALPIYTLSCVKYTPLADTTFIPVPTFFSEYSYLSIERADEQWYETGLSRTSNVYEILVYKYNKKLLMGDASNTLPGYAVYIYKSASYGDSQGIASSTGLYDYSNRPPGFVRLDTGSSYIAAGKPYIITVGI